MMMPTLAARVMARADELARLSEDEGRLTRRSFTPQMRAANDLVAGWMREAGMSVYEDNVGNLVGHYPSAVSNPKVLLLGSHLDSVRDAGRYDGPLGVLVGLAVVEGLAAAGRRLPCAVEVVAFTEEEGLRFPSFIGSRALTGTLDPAALAVRDDDGVALAEAIRAFGGDPAQIPHDARRPAELLGYCEVHIEQGPLLERQGLPVGVVSAITGINRVAVRLSGFAGHAGTVPMGLRRDALCAAAELVLACESHARATPGLVATVGQIAARPGASNVIPGAVALSLDIRHQDDAALARAVADLHEQALRICAARAVALDWQAGKPHPAVPMDPQLQSALAQAIADCGQRPFTLPSGAGHDAAVLAEICPAAMLFVRCKDGVSHNPAESVAEADVAVAIDVLSRWVEIVTQR